MLRNIRRFAKPLWTLVVFGSLAPSLLFGQATTSGTVVGHVRGPGGVSVPGATVQLTNPQTGERKETWTDESGNYTFSGLNPGNYRLDVSLVGFRPDSREPVPVTPGKELKVNVALVFALPEDVTPQPAQATGRATPTPATLPGERRGGLANLGDLENSLGNGHKQFPPSIYYHRMQGTVISSSPPCFSNHPRETRFIWIQCASRQVNPD